MNQLDSLQQQIANLDEVSYARLRAWFIEFDNSIWDRKIEVDFNWGRLDFLFNGALTEHQQGMTKEL